MDKLIRGQNNNWFEVEDILTNILSRVPVESLMICKCVSKHWRRLICSPDFIRLQLGWSRENPDYIFFNRFGKGWMKIDGDKYERLSPPGNQRPWRCETICSFNGIIVLTNYIRWDDPSMNLNIVIWNPATQEVLFLPQGTPSKRPPKVGVAFGPGINEYKVFRIFYPVPLPIYEYCECEVFSSITGSWKSIGSVPYQPLSSKQVSINGTLYWFIPEKSGLVAESILAVDSEENFRKIDLPPKVTKRLSLVDLEGCLSLISIHVNVNRFDIWVLQDYNSESSWVKKYSDNMPVAKIAVFFSVAACKNEILFIFVERYLVYNIRNRTWRELNCIDYMKRMYSSAFVFTESLLPCTGVIST